MSNRNLPSAQEVKSTGRRAYTGSNLLDLTMLTCFYSAAEWTALKKSNNLKHCSLFFFPRVPYLWRIPLLTATSKVRQKQDCALGLVFYVLNDRMASLPAQPSHQPAIPHVLLVDSPFQQRTACLSPASGKSRMLYPFLRASAFSLLLFLFVHIHVYLFYCTICEKVAASVTLHSWILFSTLSCRTTRPPSHKKRSVSCTVHIQIFPIDLPKSFTTFTLVQDPFKEQSLHFVVLPISSLSIYSF